LDEKLSMIFGHWVSISANPLKKQIHKTNKKPWPEKPSSLQAPSQNSPVMK